MLGFIFWEAISKSEFFFVALVKVIKVEWLWNPLDSFATFFLLAFLDLTVHNVQ